MLFYSTGSKEMIIDGMIGAGSPSHFNASGGSYTLTNVPDSCTG